MTEHCSLSISVAKIFFTYTSCAMCTQFPLCYVVFHVIYKCLVALAFLASSKVMTFLALPFISKMHLTRKRDSHNFVDICDCLCACVMLTVLRM